MKHLYILFFFIGQSCSTSDTPHRPQSKALVQLIYLNQKIELTNTEDTANLLTKLGQADVYISNYLDIPADRQEQFRDLKIKNFLSLFNDDIEPYSAYVFKRTRCLIEKKTDSVIFQSGVEIYWSNCTAAHKNYTASFRAVRFWKYCRDTLWEITAKDLAVYSKMSFLCDGVDLLHDENADQI